MFSLSFSLSSSVSEEYGTRSVCILRAKSLFLPLEGIP